MNHRSLRAANWNSSMRWRMDNSLMCKISSSSSQKAYFHVTRLKRPKHEKSPNKLVSGTPQTTQSIAVKTTNTLRLWQVQSTAQVAWTLALSKDCCLSGIPETKISLTIIKPISISLWQNRRKTKTSSLCSMMWKIGNKASRKTTKSLAHNND